MAPNDDRLVDDSEAALSPLDAGTTPTDDSRQRATACVAPASRGSCSIPVYWSAVFTAVECKNNVTFPFSVGARVQLSAIRAGSKIYCGYQVPVLGEVDFSSSGLYGNLAGLGACCGHISTVRPVGDTRDAGRAEVAEAFVMTCADCSFTLATGQ